MLDSILLRIAKSSILRRLDNRYFFDEEELLQEYPYLSRQGAVFVTLRYKNDLRGCIGSVTAHRTLLDDIVFNAVSAGFSDPRFNSLSLDELSHIKLEVSLLSEPTILNYRDLSDLLEKVQPNIDGLILKHKSYHGTFLPQVWEQLPTPELFLEHLSMKAGADISIYQQNPTIYRYGVDAIEENFDEVLSL